MYPFKLPAARFGVVFWRLTTIRQSTFWHTEPVCCYSQKLKQRRVDVLVLTFEKLLNSQLQYLGLADAFALVLDEAHYAQGNHPYVRIVTTFLEIPTSARPLLLALSGLPLTKVDDQEPLDIRNALQKLSSTLKAKIAYPLESFEDLNIYQIVPNAKCISSGCSPQVLRLYENILSYCKSVLGLLESVHPQLGNLTSILERDMWQLREYLRSHRRKRAGKHGSHESAAIVCHLLEVLAVLEMLEVLGSGVALKVLHKLIQNVETPTTPMEKIKKAILSPLNAILGDFKDYQTLEEEDKGAWTSLIGVLEEFLDDVDESKKCIIIVLTKRTAYKVQAMLAEMELIQRNLNPKVAFATCTNQG